DLDTGAMTARTFQGTLKPDLGKILKEGAAAGGEVYAFVYSLGGGGGLLAADAVLGNQPKPAGWPDQDPYLLPPETPDPETLLRVGYGQGTLPTGVLPAGVVRLDQTNTLTGEVQVYGNLVLGKKDALDALAPTSKIRVFAGGTFDLGGNDLADVATAIGKLNMRPSDNSGTAKQGGGIANDGTSEVGAGLLNKATLDTLFPTGEATEWDFVIGSGNPGGWTKIEDGALSGAKAFRKVGVDTVVLPDALGASANTYSGAAGTIVEGGTLVVKDVSSLGGAASTLLLTVQARGTVKFDVAGDVSYLGKLLLKDQATVNVASTRKVSLTGASKLELAGGAQAVLASGTLDNGDTVVAGSGTIDLQPGTTLIARYGSTAEQAANLFKVRDGATLYFKTMTPVAGSPNVQDAALGRMYPGATIKFEDPTMTFDVDAAEIALHGSGAGSAAYSSPTYTYKLDVASGFRSVDLWDSDTAGNGDIMTAVTTGVCGRVFRPAAYIEKTGAGLLNVYQAFAPTSPDTRILGWVVSGGTLAASTDGNSLGATAAGWFGSGKSPFIARQHLEYLEVAGGATLAWRGAQGFLPAATYGGLPEESGNGWNPDEFIIHGGATLKSSGAPLVLGYVDTATGTNYLAYPTLKGAGTSDVPVITLGGDINFRSGIKMDTKWTSGKADVNVTAGSNVQFTRDLETGVGGIDVDNNAPSMDMIRNLDVSTGGTATIYNSHDKLEQTTLTASTLAFDPGTGNPPITYKGTVSLTGGTIHALSGTTNLGLLGSTVVAGATIPGGQKVADPINRWSFSEVGGAGTTLVDSVGGKNGTIVEGGANNADVGTTRPGQVYLTGGAKASSDYVRLPAGLVSGLTDMTIETWATQETVQNWSRIFDFGVDTTNYILMSWTQATTLASDRMCMQVGNVQHGTNDTMSPYTLGQPFHIVMTVDDNGGPAGETQLKCYLDGVYRGTLNTTYNLSEIVDTNNFLGRSQYGDNTANASWNEFRIYNYELTDAAIAAGFALGPEGLALLPYDPVYSTIVVENGAELKLGGFSGMDTASAFGTLSAGAGPA
ncbi:MAG: LamG domain-containing protein, partial [Planctomycetota bacterium]|nr:LamG domain-containing protein [Planctomycetota bacterium]